MMIKLPVDAIRPEFEDLLERNAAPIIVTAPTGSGKSTRLPGWMSQRGKVMVVEPRRVACRSLAGFLSRQAGEEVGQSVGYSIRFEDVRSAKTRVVFVTPGVALRMLGGRDFEFDAVLIDEFHERGWEVDLIATILNQKRQSGEVKAPLVFTSATLDAQALSQSMGATILEAQGRTFPVDISYDAQGVAMPSRENLEGRVERAVRQIMARDDEGEILVFLPGKGEIGACARQLSWAQRQGVEVMEVHASLPMKALMRAFEDPVAGRRRIFLATNVAETSVTLPGVTWVIDSGLVRMQLHRAGRTALALVPTSQASMDQRAGRAGRVRPGQCIRLWAAHWAPQAVTPPEIERIELDDMLLRAALCGLDGAAFDAAPWVTPPPQFALEEARARLQGLRALDASHGLTPRGERLAGLPVSAHEARLLLDPPPELATAVADLVAVLQRGTRLLLPPERGAGSVERVREAREVLFRGVKDEVTEALVALRRGSAHKHALHGAALSETRRIATSLRRMLNLKHTNPTKGGEPLPDPERLAAYLLERAPEMGFVMRARAKRHLGKPTPETKRRSKSMPWANGQIEVSVAPYVPHCEEDRPDATDLPTAGVLLEHTWLGDRKGYGVHGFGRLLLPCAPAVMAEHVKGEVELGQITVTKRRGKTLIQAPVKRVLAGVVLTSKEEPLRGAALWDAAAKLTLERRLFKGAREPLLDALHLWDLLTQWKPTLETEHWNLAKIQAQAPASDAHAYLVGQLEELGLNTCEDLMLLEPEDLVPDIAQRSGLMSYELDALSEQFPRQWEHLGAQYDCHVNVAARKVTLEPANHQARKAKEPSRDVLPRFQGFRVFYKQASRVFAIRG